MQTSQRARTDLAFSLFLWGNDEGADADKYRMMFEVARFADAAGFAAVWTPERHFHAFGGAYPNPAVTSAAIAAVTQRTQIRGGSCVAPLHPPARIAEEWAVVDNLSHGRVGIGFASGWQPDDFLLRPESYPDFKRALVESVDIVRKLWRGERVRFRNGLGHEIEVLTQPRPMQRELPLWITAAGNPDTYRLAGSLGANLLTHLLGQSVDEVQAKIAVYRNARAEAGFDPDEGIVSLMLHSYVGDDVDQVRELVRAPLKRYLASAVSLVKSYAWSFPAFKRPRGEETAPADIDLTSLTPEELDAILEFAFERYFATSGLFGTPASCQEMIDRCRAAGVDDIACLVDFGVPADAVLSGLPQLALTRELACARIELGALARPDGARKRPEHVAPASALEQAIARAWRETLQLPEVGVYDNFFDLGGHSLLVVRLHRQLQGFAPRPVSLTDLYRFPTIAALAEFLDADPDANTGTVRDAADRGQRRRESLERRRRGRPGDAG